MEKGPLVTTVATDQVPAGFQSCWSPSVSPPAPAQHRLGLPEPPTIPFPHGSFPQAAGFRFSKPFPSPSKVCRHANTWKKSVGSSPGDSQQTHPGSLLTRQPESGELHGKVWLPRLWKGNKPKAFESLRAGKGLSPQNCFAPRSYSNPLEPHIFAY